MHHVSARGGRACAAAEARLADAKSKRAELKREGTSAEASLVSARLELQARARAGVHASSNTLVPNSRHARAAPHPHPQSTHQAHSAAQTGRKAAEEELGRLQAGNSKLKKARSVQDVDVACKPSATTFPCSLCAHDNGVVLQDIQALTDQGYQVVAAEQAEKLAFVSRCEALQATTR